MIAWLKAVVIIVSAVVGVGSVYIAKMKHDNPVEETCEQIIKDETGLDIDLTPSSQEVKKSDIALEPKNESDKAAGK